MKGCYLIDNNTTFNHDQYIYLYIHLRSKFTSFHHSVFKILRRNSDHEIYRT